MDLNAGTPLEAAYPFKKIALLSSILARNLAPMSKIFMSNIVPVAMGKHRTHHHKNIEIGSSTIPRPCQVIERL